MRPRRRTGLRVRIFAGLPAAASLPALSDGSGMVADIAQLALSHLATSGKPRPDRSPDQLGERHLLLEGDALERLVELFVERDRRDHHAFPAFGSLLSHDSIILQYCDTVHPSWRKMSTMTVGEPSMQPGFIKTKEPTGKLPRERERPVMSIEPPRRHL